MKVTASADFASTMRAAATRAKPSLDGKNPPLASSSIKRTLTVSKQKTLTDAHHARQKHPKHSHLKQNLRVRSLVPSIINPWPAVQWGTIFERYIYSGDVDEVGIQRPATGSPLLDGSDANKNPGNRSSEAGYLRNRSNGGSLTFDWSGACRLHRCGSLKKMMPPCLYEMGRWRRSGDIRKEGRKEERGG